MDLVTDDPEELQLWVATLRKALATLKGEIQPTVATIKQELKMSNLRLEAHMQECPPGPSVRTHSFLLLLFVSSPGNNQHENPTYDRLQLVAAKQRDLMNTLVVDRSLLAHVQKGSRPMSSRTCKAFATLSPTISRANRSNPRRW